MLAPPCIRQRLLCTAGAWHGAPRLAFPIAAWILGEMRPSQNYSEGSFLRREIERWRYAGPSSLYDATALLSRISHNLARLLSSFLEI